MRRTPKKDRPDTLNAPSLFGDTVQSADPDVQASAFIGRLQATSIYTLVVAPYAQSGGDFDITNKKIKNMFRFFVITSKWTQEKFFRVLARALETDSDLNRFVFGKLGRLYDTGRMPYGKLADVKTSEYHYVIGDE